MKQAGVGILVALALLAAPMSRAGAASASGTPRFRYDVATPAVYAKVRPGDVVVIGPQDSEAAEQLAVNTVHARGAKAYRYQQWYWHPNGREYEGVNITQQQGWAFCAHDNAPLVDTVSHEGRKWTYLDTNERSVRNAIVASLVRLRALGYDGIFVDRAAAAITGPWALRTSTCTADPVERGRKVAHSYVAIMAQARSVGLRVALNAGPLGLLNSMAVGVSAIMSSAYLLDESAAKRGVGALKDDARIAAARRRVAWTLIRPGPTAAAEDANAVQVPAVKVIHGVRANEDVP